MTHLVWALAASQQDADQAAGMLAGILGLGFFVVWCAIVVLMIASGWKIFSKAGKPGWAAIVPIYNIIVLLEIVKKPLWWIVLFFVPLANFVAVILVSIALAEKFGKSTGFGLGLAFLGFIFAPILAFGDARYKG
jgi:hypothetical protein